MTEGYIGEMNGCDCAGVAARELFSHCATPVAAMRTEAPVSKFIRHQTSPKVVDVLDPHALNRILIRLIDRFE